MSTAVQILHDNVSLFVDRMVARLTIAMPAYARLDGPGVRASVEGFTRDILEAVETGSSEKLAARLRENSAERVAQGLSLSEYMNALFVAGPVCREVVRELGPRNDPSLAKGTEELEARLHEITALAATVFTDSAAQQLRSKIESSIA